MFVAGTKHLHVCDMFQVKTNQGENGFLLKKLYLYSDIQTIILHLFMQILLSYCFPLPKEYYLAVSAIAF